MAKYELTFLLPEEAELKTIKELAEALKVKIVTEETWGQKTLAFPIKKKHTAYFYNWLIEMERNQMAEFKKRLNFQEKLLRYLLLAK